MLPALLEAVDSKAWRAKQGSVQLLGAMAFCAPRQLGTALPQVNIIPVTHNPLHHLESI